MTIDEQDKITEMVSRLHASAVVLDEYERDTKAHNGALWGIWDVIGILDSLIEACEKEAKPRCTA